MSYDVSAVRAHFPALKQGAAHFDGPGGPEVPDVVGGAVRATLVAAIANRGRVTEAERTADDTVLAAGQAVADVLGGEQQGVVFGRSMTQLTFDFSRALAKTWRPGDEVVVTRLDHDANVRPWVYAAEAAGATLRWAEFDPATGELSPQAVASVLSDRTRPVALALRRPARGPDRRDDRHRGARGPAQGPDRAARQGPARSHRLVPGRAAHPDPAADLRRPGRRGRVPAPGQAERERAGRFFLRPRGVALAGPGRRRRPADRPGALQQRRRRQPAARRS